MKKLNYEDLKMNFELMNLAFAIHKMDFDEENNPVDYEFIEINKNFEEYLGLSRENILNKKVSTIFPDIKNDPGDWINKYGKVASTQIPLTFEQYFPPHNKWYKIYSFSHKIGYFSVVFIDISERKKMEEILKESNIELEQFAFIASHDLQEPLRMIYTFLELIKKRYIDKLGIEAIELFDFALNSSRRMKNLITDLLKISTINTEEEFEIIDTKKLLNESLLDLKLLIEETNTSIEFKNLPQINGDINLLKQVFINIIGNSIKYRKKNVDPIILIDCKQDGEFLKFSIKDNGIGINMDYKNKVFLIFSRLHLPNEYSGTGIGLAIVKRIINSHQGKVWFESTLGEGSTFYFTIPI